MIFSNCLLFSYFSLSAATNFAIFNGSLNFLRSCLFKLIKQQNDQNNATPAFAFRKYVVLKNSHCLILVRNLTEVSVRWMFTVNHVCIPWNEIVTAPATTTINIFCELFETCQRKEIALKGQLGLFASLFMFRITTETLTLLFYLGIHCFARTPHSTLFQQMLLSAVSNCSKPNCSSERNKLSSPGDRIKSN